VKFNNQNTISPLNWNQSGGLFTFVFIRFHFLSAGMQFIELLSAAISISML